MPEASLEVCFNLPVDSIWEFISDLKNIGSCLRFIGETQKTSDSLIWKVKSPMSITTRTSTLKPEFLREEENRFLSWIARGENLQWSGSFDLESLKQGQTKVKIELGVSGTGPMAVIINPTAALQIKNQLKYLVEQLKKKTEGESISLEGSGRPFCDEEGGK
ncbi:MAG: SRPBCC family protein [candidate division Zixibacteria bacterium]|nr:SRPBCC family protein [candidate division Zixibacteria bacterium]